MTHYVVVPAYGQAMLAQIALQSITNTVQRDDVKVLMRWADSPLQPEGFTRAANDLFAIALRDPEMESVTLVATDVEILTKNWLSKLLYYSHAHQDVGIIAPQELLMSEEYKASLLPYSGERLLPGEGTGKELVYAIFAMVFITRDCLRKVGLMDEAFNPGSYDDFDYCLRARQMGFRTVWDAEVQYKHVRGATIGPLVEAGIYEYPTKQAEYFYNKWKDLTWEGEDVESLLTKLRGLRDKNYATTDSNK